MLGVYYDNTHIAFRAERVAPPSSGCSPRMYQGLRQCAADRKEVVMELGYPLSDL